MSIGERLREERKRLGLSQEELGVQGGVRKLAQFNYEKGERSPDAEYLCAVADVGVDIAYVVTGRRTVEDAVPLKAATLAAWQAYRAARAMGTDLSEETFGKLFSTLCDTVATHGVSELAET